MTDEQEFLSNDQLVRRYLTGSNVMATWNRCTGWIPPSQDPVIVKKWVDFHIAMTLDKIAILESGLMTKKGTTNVI